MKQRKFLFGGPFCSTCFHLAKGFCTCIMECQPLIRKMVYMEVNGVSLCIAN
uniref:Uncharacterized protein n=1 Tax=Nelumbo nucifera TaxID=4432 RepID=A0A822ZL38_NELNU|nr:TPA_asm: hypothetical protein HUJ06_003693 [Nelumbo nucifera]